MIPALSLCLNSIPVEYYSAYLIDYKIGFTSRALIGSVVSVLTSNITVQWLNGFIFITFLLTFSLLSFLLSRLLHSCEDELKSILLYCVLFLSFFQLSVRIYVKYYGILDIYWFLFLLLSLVCLSRGFTSLFVPGLCFLGLATNYAFAFTYMPVIAFLLVYNIYEKKFTISRFSLTVIGLFVMAASSVYFFIFANNTLVMTPDQIVEYLSSKVTFPVFEEYIYLYFSKNSESFLQLLAASRGYVPNFFSSLEYYPLFVRSATVLLCILILWIRAFRFSLKKIEKGLLLIGALMPIVSLPAFLFSLDIDRFLAQLIIAQFSLIFYLIYKRNDAVTLAVNDLYNRLKAKPIFLVILLVLTLFY